MTQLILGVDPGGAHTGICQLVGGDPVNWEAVTRDRKQSMNTYLAAIATAAVRHTQDLLATGGDVLVAIEEMNAPHSHYRGKKSFIKPQAMIDAGKAVGAVYAAVQQQTAADILMVPPGKHGKAPFWSYPNQLKAPGETTGTGKGPMQHVRAAYDIAQAAPYYAATT